MTTGALLPANRTGRRHARRRPGFLRIGEMTGETLGIVKRGVALDLFMRVMTGRTTDARVALVVPTAVKDSIRLEAYVVRPSLCRQLHDLPEATVA